MSKKILDHLVVRLARSSRLIPEVILNGLYGDIGCPESFHVVHIQLEVCYVNIEADVNEPKLVSGIVNVNVKIPVSFEAKAEGPFCSYHAPKAEMIHGYLRQPSFESSVTR